MFIDHELVPPLDSVLGEISNLEKVIELEDGVVTARAGTEHYSDFVKDAPVLEIANSISDEDTPRSLTYTSCTTGIPKC